MSNYSMHDWLMNSIRVDVHDDSIDCYYKFGDIRIGVVCRNHGYTRYISRNASDKPLASLSLDHCIDRIRSLQI